VAVLQGFLVFGGVVGGGVAGVWLLTWLGLGRTTGGVGSADWRVWVGIDPDAGWLVLMLLGKESGSSDVAAWLVCLGVGPCGGQTSLFERPLLALRSRVGRRWWDRTIRSGMGVGISQRIF
jgi:hypothetical protein